MSKWQTAKLGDLLTLRRDRVELLFGTTYKRITVKLSGLGVVLRDEVDGSAIKSEVQFIARAGQFVASKIDARNGSFGLVPPHLDGSVVSGNFLTFDCNPDRLLPKFIEYYANRPTFWEQCSQISEGTTNRVPVRVEQFMELPIQLPPLAEQQRLVARIEGLAAQIHEARTLRHQAAEEAEAFVTSVHDSLSGSRKKKLGDILKLDEDEVPIEITGSYSQVGVKSFGGGLFPKGAVEGTGTTYRTFNRLYDGAFLLSQVKGWEGAVAICPPELAGWFVSPEYRTFRCIPTESRARYLAPLVRTEWFWSKLANATRGVGARRERTRPEQFLNIELPMPDVEKQKYGEVLFAEVGVLKRVQAETAAELDALLPAILDKAFKGEL
ncbi:MAG: restriction endonuclease subunit S [Verrucomicrobiota bacterium]|jgi:type I restriction enzyme S subunit